MASRIQATQDLNDEMAVGRELAMRLKSFVKASFGRKDPRLAAFGIKPFSRSRYKPPEPERRKSTPGFH